MQIYPTRKVQVNRDMDLIRELLMRINDDPQFDGRRKFRADTPEELGVPGHSMDEISYHLDLLIEDGFIKGSINPNIGMPVISRLTWKGHEFLDDIRDPDVWDKTKERAKGLTSIGFALVWEIAKAEIRKKMGL